MRRAEQAGQYAGADDAAQVTACGEDAGGHPCFLRFDGFYNGYGEGAPNGRGPSQPRVQSEGNEYLKKDFPNLDYIKKATVVPAAK